MYPNITATDRSHTQYFVTNLQTETVILEFIT